MKILHICNLSNSPFSGISVAVPQHVQAQSLISDAFVWNLSGKKIDCSVKQICEQDFYSCSFDVVVFHGVYFVKYVKIGRYLKKKGVPYVIFPHGSLTKVSLGQKWLKKRIANIFVFSRFVRDASAVQFLTTNEMKTSLYATKGFVCGNGVSIPAIKKSWGRQDEYKRFVYIGRFDVFHKGIDLLLDAVSLEKDFLKKEGFVLNLYGPNQKDVNRKCVDAHTVLNRMVQQREIDSIVHINEAVYGEKKLEILLENDVFIQTSRSEGLPLGILEALSIGMPCLVTKGTNLADQVNEYQAGWGVDTSSEEIASAIKSTVLMQGSLDEISKSAINLVEENFTWDKIAKKEIDVYKRVVERI